MAYKAKAKPIKEIDWIFVDECLEVGNDGVEIALGLGVHPETLYQRCKIEKDIVWSVYAQRKRAHGLKNLRLSQYRKATGIHPGNADMQKWLGKQWLGQKENITDNDDDKPPQEPLLLLQDENIRLRNEVRLLKEQQGNNATQPQTGTELPRIDSAV